MKKVSAIIAKSGYKWQAHVNSSWGESHQISFGNKKGFVICYENRNNQLVPLASVIGQFQVSQQEIEANAKLIEKAPKMAQLINELAGLNEDLHEDLSAIIRRAKDIEQELYVNESKQIEI